MGEFFKAGHASFRGAHRNQACLFARRMLAGAEPEMVLSFFKTGAAAFQGRKTSFWAAHDTERLPKSNRNPKSILD
jgi:hypothetical protein